MNWKGHAFELYRRWAHMWMWPVLWYEERKGICSGYSERGVEWAYALDVAARQKGETALDVGSGWTSWPYMMAAAGFRTTAIDLWDWGFVRRFGGNRHYRVLRMDITKDETVLGLLERNGGPFDYISCISTLEHMPILDAVEAMKNMGRLLAPGGSLVTTFPYGPRRALAQETPFTQVYSEDEIARFALSSRLENTLTNEKFFSCWAGGAWRAKPRRNVCKQVPFGSPIADLHCATWRH